MTRFASIIFALSIALASCTTARKEPPMPTPYQKNRPWNPHAWFIDYNAP